MTSDGVMSLKEAVDGYRSISLSSLVLVSLASSLSSTLSTLVNTLGQKRTDLLSLLLELVLLVSRPPAAETSSSSPKSTLVSSEAAVAAAGEQVRNDGCELGGGGSKLLWVSLVYAIMKSPSCFEITTARASSGKFRLGD